MKTILLFMAWCLIADLFSAKLLSQNVNKIYITSSCKKVQPLDTINLVCHSAGTISVKDGKGRAYVHMKAMLFNSFNAGGAAGIQTISLIDKNGKTIGYSTFILEAKTDISDGGKMAELFKILYNGMIEEGKKGYNEIKWGDSSYKFYVPWDLDNNNVMNGIQYFVPYGDGLTNLLRQTQRADGMIWSFVATENDGAGSSAYFESAYGSLNFFRKDKDAFFVRQPVDNHSDYNYVNMFYKHWRASGNNEWMKKTLPSAALALDYCYTDSIRWSKRFQLLKRPYCIDSWDFQVNDEYTPAAPISPTMVVVPGKTKYGVFFGDNTGYYEACNQLAEMYDYSHQKEKAAIFRTRGAAILKNLIRLSWNGKYFTHFIDEDPSVKRNLGVDEKTQIAQGNMYSLNRGLPNEINRAIIKTYQQLKENLPIGSEGEWYSIYPPFPKGFSSHNEIWQYMNGGIAGHAIGELARGAYENGYENYGSDIIMRMLALGKKYSNKIWFSYTGSIPLPPAPPVFKPIDITASANMDLWDKGAEKSFAWMNAKGPGNDMRGLPVERQIFKNILFNVIDPAKNQRRSVIAVSVLAGFPRQADVWINDTAGSVYLLHSSSDNVPGNVAGSISFLYADGTESSQYMIKGTQVTNWWFPDLTTERSGVAWYGPNLKSTKVGVCWAVIDNPFPTKKIKKLQFNAPLEGGIYAVLGITLADKPFYIAPKGESFGGPDNWAAANGMAALIEGLAGIKNEGLAFDEVLIAPRWPSAKIDSVNVTVNFPASNGYVAYQYINNTIEKQITIKVTGSGKQVRGHILLPQESLFVSSVTVDGRPLKFSISIVGQSKYLDFELNLPGVHKVIFNY